MIEFYYPNATKILDWYHATQYLYKIVDAVFEKDSYDVWIDKTKTLLRKDQVSEVINECDYFSKDSSTSKEAHAAVTFYTNNQECINYKQFRVEGYFIGSGKIESGAKRLGELRLKEAGLVGHELEPFKLLKPEQHGLVSYCC